jgi:hypothetical protein
MDLLSIKAVIEKQEETIDTDKIKFTSADLALIREIVARLDDKLVGRHLTAYFKFQFEYFFKLFGSKFIPSLDQYAFKCRERRKRVAVKIASIKI